jgi:hypothetical protein
MGNRNKPNGLGGSGTVLQYASWASSWVESYRRGGQRLSYSPTTEALSRERLLAKVLDKAIVFHQTRWKKCDNVSALRECCGRYSCAV